MQKTLSQYIDQIHNNPESISEQLNIYISQAQTNKYNSWLKVLDSEYISNIYNLDEIQNKPLCGAPIWVKDLIMIQWITTTCGSKILVDYVPPYTATCIENLINSWWIVIGKNNLDEFAMWWSGENSAFGVVQNPAAPWRIVGWSSSGSAASVAAGECIVSIGTDTGGSVRQPAAMSGIVWFKPTYGFVSRYGVQSMANSLDQVWVLANNVDDAWTILQYIWWYDPKDSTSQDYKTLLNSDDSVRKIAVFKQFYSAWLDPQIADRLNIYISKLKESGYIVEEIDFDLLDYVVAVYYTIMPAEASTNLSRFDGIKFGLQDDTSRYSSYIDYYTAMRTKWFGEEVKRRIMIGSYVLSEWFADQYYQKAIQIRNAICAKFDEVFSQYDAVLSPTSPVAARAIWSVDDPLADYLTDIYTIPANLAWLPAISVPAGTVVDNRDNLTLPVWLQIMSAKRNEPKLVKLAKVIENIKI